MLTGPALPQLQALTELLHGGADPEAKDNDGNTALHCAAESGSHEVVAAVLSATGGAGGGASRPPVRASSLPAGRGARRQKHQNVSPPSAPGILTAVNKKGWAALHVAAAHGHAAAARLLIARGVAAKVPDAAGRLPIHIASAAGHAKIVELLIRRKPATLAAKDRSGATPLLLALANRRSAAVAALLDSGADPNVVNELSGRTALSLAAERGSPELLSLLRHGADVEAPCEDGRAALHWAVDAQQVRNRISRTSCADCFKMTCHLHHALHPQVGDLPRFLGYHGAFEKRALPVALEAYKLASDPRALGKKTVNT